MEVLSWTIKLGLGNQSGTWATLSLPARAMMSAHDTTPGHSFSTAALIWSNHLKFRMPVWECDSFSAGLLAVESSKNDASHPCIVIQIPNHIAQQ